MSHSIHSSALRERLVRQLIVLGEEKQSFLDAYFPMHGKERIQTHRFITQYVSFTEDRLSASNEELEASVFVGCEVTIDYLEYRTTDTFEIVFPHEAEPDRNRISFLSPVGMQLLMGHRDEVIPVAIPSGEMRVRISRIGYPNEES
ncbi:GreA/GreB family elongation factor [Paenibacillus arenilitoris]|uniref:GreA/GreB family elongation factor n=1 Tax=Paenibacillus arenilitoris TaxID=2772299 RepID=A0A927H5C4_9BACL|nr:GreA/GreB family elongation factor [Paenibacillus arenilitoris]MBD2867409.1 GreA/GreB family elongation factor [Paenibacillus arenilitoris]